MQILARIFLIYKPLYLFNCIMDPEMFGEDNCEEKKRRNDLLNTIVDIEQEKNSKQ